ncbi:hypothetical protein BOTNAR_0236g00110 [Botryotinia narcissicola]|uniref:Uncharacterized protein n=1 Tax=Botryotinia narcissicola TaxID=278944 RepID=A0A4Z1IGI8_9HELO|nr:hypothetical protein BOTNAR_0236g00110 [Botryotinia narcissicola]
MVSYTNMAARAPTNERIMETFAALMWMEYQKRVALAFLVFGYEAIYWAVTTIYPGMKTPGFCVLVQTLGMLFFWMAFGRPVEAVQDVELGRGVVPESRVEGERRVEEADGHFKSRCAST